MWYHTCQPLDGQHEQQKWDYKLLTPCKLSRVNTHRAITILLQFPKEKQQALHEPLRSGIQICLRGGIRLRVVYMGGIALICLPVHLPLADDDLI